MTRLLLDTCILIDWAIDPKRLRDEGRISIANPSSIVYVSAVSAFEIAIKQQIGKLKSPSDVGYLISDNRFFELPVSIEHASHIRRLPLLHKDPFDRLLISQARCEKLILVTRDRDIQKYDVPTLTA